jgi:hypothetical protein
VNDPFPDVAHIAAVLVSKVRNFAHNAMPPGTDMDLLRRSGDLASLGASGSRSRSPMKQQRARKVEKRLNSFSNLLSLRKGGDQPEEDDDDDDVPDISQEEIRSMLYDWCCSYFSAPLNKPSVEDETAPDYSQRKWRQQRNEHLIKEAKSVNEKVFQILGCRKLENEIAILENEGQMVSMLLFHPFENIVAVSDEKSGVSVWNWEEGVKINHFNNFNPVGTRITSLQLVNEYDIAMISSASGSLLIIHLSGFCFSFLLLSFLPPTPCCPTMRLRSWFLRCQKGSVNKMTACVPLCAGSGVQLCARFHLNSSDIPLSTGI